MNEQAQNIPAIEMRKVCKAFGHKPVLRNLDLTIRAGETYAILGGSGSGKSVCLKHMNGLLRPDSGSVWVDGVDITKFSEEGLIEVRKACGMLFQSGALFDSLSVFENVAYPLREHLQLSKAQLAERVDWCLASVGLAGSQHLMPSELSGGMRKRVGLARVIALQPKTILYDEPTTGLDPGNSRRIGKLIRSLQEQLHVTSVVVTHDLELCFAVADRIGLLKDGAMVSSGSVAAMRNSTHPVVHAFLRGEQDAPLAALDASEVNEANEELGAALQQHGNQNEE